MTIARASIEQANTYRARRVMKAAKAEFKVLQLWFTATLFALPFGLLAGEGAIRWIGVAYAVAYAAALLPATGVHVLMGYDAVRLILRKKPILAPHILGIGLAVAARIEKMGKRPSGPWHRQLMIYANPCFGLASALGDLAATTNPTGVAETYHKAEAISQALLGGTASRAAIVAIAEREAEDWRERLRPRHSQELPAYC